ncbi:MAG TPA: DUF4337 family protein [Solirubrobacteraceae bacterium]|jgi:hypothetical protein|nr:DUF4337 family protein [Solirubrobacteraceae bacterium]
MEAHEAFERFEKGHELADGGGHHSDRETAAIGRLAAVVVACIAAVLAVATFLANEAVKEVITGETKAADTSARLEANDTKKTIADANSVLLHVVAGTNAKEGRAAAKAIALEHRVDTELIPLDKKLAAQITDDIRARDKADRQHFMFELSEVGLQIAIVLSSISILARRRSLLYGGATMGVVGLILTVSGLLTT